jgi:quercetin dioxygenase-like cupin family protein
MSTKQNIVRRQLLKVALGQRNVTNVDIRSIRFTGGQKTGLHTHPCPVVGYIAEGVAILQVEGEPEQRLETGSSFYEPAATKILRFDNASSVAPLHFIAVYLMNGDHPLIEMLE